MVLRDADLLVHVVDLTSHNAAEQCQTVEAILTDLNIQDKPRITALNKIDLMLDKTKCWDEVSAVQYLTVLDLAAQCPIDENTIFIAAGKKWGLSRLLELMKQMIPTVPQEI
jgi:GTP-binding protein HflX